jgi:FkbM family methyltransferase
MLSKLKKIFRILFPVKMNSKESFELKIKKNINVLNFEEVDSMYLLTLKGGVKLLIRGEAHSDYEVFKQIFVCDEYLIVKSLLKNRLLKKKLRMIDAGANVGFTSLYFMVDFDNIEIIAVEPSHQNFLLLNKNIILNNAQNKVFTERKAISDRTGKKFDISSDFRDGKDWSNITVENKVGLIDSITINDLIKKYQFPSIDFLKIDIEGAERYIFNEKSDTTFLSRVCLIAIEIHDEFEIRSYIENLLISKGFIIFKSGELTIGINPEIYFIKSDFQLK